MGAESVRKRLKEGDLVLGTMVMAFTVPAVARISAAAGAEFVLFDMEHTDLSLNRLGVLAEVARDSDIEVWVRVPSARYQRLHLPLDLGVDGIMLPSVDTAETAERAVTAAKYPPDGKRGVALGIAHDGYQRGNPIETMKNANDNTTIVAQIETVEGVENTGDIAAVEGIDVLWVGHNDLTTSMGIPGEFEHARYIEALEHVEEQARTSGKVAGFRPDSIEQATFMVDLGYRCLAYLSDISAYRNAISQGVDVLRMRHL